MAILEAAEEPVWLKSLRRQVRISLHCRRSEGIDLERGLRIVARVAAALYIIVGFGELIFAGDA
jgi:hypothetical protein